MKKKIILIISCCIIAVVICLVVILIVSNNKKGLGVYHYDKDNETLTLKADSECTMHPSWAEEDIDICTWSIEDDDIKVNYRIYGLYYNKYSNNHEYRANKTECEIDAMKRESYYCEEKEIIMEGTFVDNGVLIDGKHFEKIG